MDDQKKHTDEKNLILNDEIDLLLDHEYDGIQELNNPMPPWWLYGFYLTIALSVVYLLYYDVTGWGPSQIDEYEQEMAAAAERYGPVNTEIDVADYSELVAFTDLQNLEAGRVLYMSPANLCVTCHGANAQGLVGPDLTNEFWKHGCDLEAIMISIKSGFPSMGMPAYGSGVSLTDEQLQQLSSYLISIRGSIPEGAKPPNMARSVECTL